MAFLSGLFGNGGESDNNSDLLGALTAVASVDASYESYDQSIDEDGSSDTSYDSGSFGLDLDVGSILSSMTDSFSDSDGGGIFG
jgi:hypothetical protein